MTLATLRSRTRLLISDTDATSGVYTETQLNDIINSAMRKVVDIVVAISPHVLLVDYTANVANVGSAFTVLIDLSAQTYPRVRKLIRAENTTTLIKLSQIDYTDIDTKKQAAMRADPPIYLFKETFGFVQPTNNTPVKVTYIPAMPSMTADTDTPGVAGGTGTANLLPEDWQDLIPIRAALMILAADRRDTADMRTEYAEQRQGLVDSVLARRRTPENG